MKWYLKAWKNYATFSGRASRKEYWSFVLWNLIISFAIGFFSGLIPALVVVATLYPYAVLLPGITVAARRMHDTDHSGWWLLCPFVNLVFALTKGDQEANRFGPEQLV